MDASASQLAWSVYNYLDALRYHIHHPTFAKVISKCRDLICENKCSFPKDLFHKLEDSVFHLDMLGSWGDLVEGGYYTTLIERSKSEVRKYVIKNGLIKVRMTGSGDIGTLSKLDKDILHKISTQL
ncbi:hypothetical protein EB118_18675 [bacterium]|nr:hypothetical protein [bacterium]NDD85106.1 hypothetical protein [bacterium]NDG32086.1 hypothetical protein [bacterium]